MQWCAFQSIWNTKIGLKLENQELGLALFFFTHLSLTLNAHESENL